MTEPSRDVLEVVFVCTGNQARSPLAEGLFRRYSAGIETRVSSFGTLAVGDAIPALPEAVAAADHLGIDLSHHRASTLGRSALESADLVVGFEPFHVSAAVIDARAHVSRAFLFGELVTLFDRPSREDDRLPNDDPLRDARAAIALADTRRIRARPDVTRIVDDPLGGPAQVMFRVASEIDVLVRQLTVGLFGRIPLDEDADDVGTLKRPRLTS